MNGYLRSGQFDIIAHRGGGLEAPENTLPAFENAARVFKDAVFELDVHRTRDGKIIVLHDDTLDRTTNGTGFAWDHTWDQIKELDAGYRYTTDGKTYPWRGLNVKIPLLSEILARFPASRVSIEIKHAHPFFGKDIVNVVENAGAKNRVVLASETHKFLSEARGHAHEICSGFSSREVLQALIATWTHVSSLAPTHGQVYQVPLRHGFMPIVTPQFIRHAHQRGKAVHVWTVNDEATMRHLIEMGVDGIISDAPSLLCKVARDLKKI